MRRTESLPTQFAEMALEEFIETKLGDFLRRCHGYPVENLYDEVMLRIERPLFALVLSHTDGNQLRAAEILGLHRNTLRQKLTKLGLGGKTPKVRPVRPARKKHSRVHG